MGALFEPMLLLPTHMYVPESETVTSGMSRVPISVRSARVWGGHAEAEPKKVVAWQQEYSDSIVT